MSLTLSNNVTEPEVFFPFNIFLLAKIILLLYYFITIAFFLFPSLSLSLACTHTKSIERNIENALFSLFYYKKGLQHPEVVGFTINWHC